MTQTRPARQNAGTSALPIAVAGAGIIIAAVLTLRLLHHAQSTIPPHAFATGCSQAGSAFRAHRSGEWLQLSGTVVRLLADTQGTRVHQRFVLACPNGQTILVVDDVSIGRRVPVATGDQVAVRGQYVWNAEGGLVHFTHHALSGTQSGWIAFQGKLYSLAGATLF